MFIEVEWNLLSKIRYDFEILLLVTEVINELIFFMQNIFSFTNETVYGIDVYRFQNSNGVEFQLTFEKSLCGQYINVRLVNLSGQFTSLYCKNLRRLISNIIYEYLVSHNCILFFDIKLNSDRKYSLLIKFLRWIELESRVKTNLGLRYCKNNLFVEVFLSLTND